MGCGRQITRDWRYHDQAAREHSGFGDKGAGLILIFGAPTCFTLVLRFAIAPV